MESKPSDLAVSNLVMSKSKGLDSKKKLSNVMESKPSDLAVSNLVTSKSKGLDSKKVLRFVLQ